MNVGISVMVCCYNSEKRLPNTLEHLAKQSLIHKNGFSIELELIIVDNASTDNTSSRAIQLWEALNNPYPIRVIEEKEPGLSFAREAGLNAAKYAILCMVDDDNWLCSDYFLQAAQILRKDPNLAGCGGQGFAAFDDGFEVPDWFESVQHSWALGPQAEKEGRVSKERGYLYGAGLVLKKDAWLHLKKRGFTSILADRKGKSLQSGGDVELCFAIMMSGKEFYYCPSMTFYHLMPAGRVNLDYFKRLYSASGITSLGYDAYKNRLTGFSNNWFFQLARSFVAAICYGFLSIFKSKDLRYKSYSIYFYARFKALLQNYAQYQGNKKQVSELVKRLA